MKIKKFEMIGRYNFEKQTVFTNLVSTHCLCLEEQIN